MQLAPKNRAFVRFFFAQNRKSYWKTEIYLLGHWDTLEKYVKSLINITLFVPVNILITGTLLGQNWDGFSKASNHPLETLCALWPFGA